MAVRRQAGFKKKGEAMISRTVRLLLAGTAGFGAIGSATVAQAQAGADTVANTPIVVTAQRREQLLTDVPQALTVVGGDALERQQATSLTDYVGLVPGLSLQQSNPGQTRVVLRGINTGSASATVSLYLDDTPFGSSTGQTNGAVLAADFDTFDVERIEVLRGPQGTLYGSNALGGVIKYITVEPALGTWEAAGQASIAAVEHGGTDWSGTALVNIPLGEMVAVRASGYYRRDAGFIDAPSRSAENVNETQSYGGRISLLFQPTDTFSVRLMALAQNIRADSRAAFDANPVSLDPVVNDPFTAAPLRGMTRTEAFPDQNDVDYRLYTGAVEWDIGFANLTSVTSYGELEQREFTDVSYTEVGPGVTLADVITGLYGSADPLGVTFPSFITMEKFTQEVRLASQDSDSFEWLIGGYYTREPGLIFQRYFPFDVATGTLQDPMIGPFPDLVLATLDSVYKETAVFGSATVYLSQNFDITVGGRYSHNRQRTTQVLDGALFGGRSQLNGDSSEGVFTWSVSPRWQVNDDLAVYARVAKGYRPGGPNVVPPGAGPDYPFEFDADTLLSYEIGARGQTGDGTFGFDVSLYYLDWSDIQVIASFDSAAGPVNADANGDTARSLGAEGTFTFRPIRGLTAIASVAYNDAQLTEDLPAGLGGFNGDQLPYAPEWSANLMLDYEWALSNNATAFVGGNIRLVSDQPADFDSGYIAAFGRRAMIDGYHTVDLRAGIEFDNFSVTAFARNVTDSSGLVNVGLLGTRPGGAIEVAPIRPRTIGVSLGFEL